MISLAGISTSTPTAHVTYPARFQLIAAMNPCSFTSIANLNRTFSATAVANEA